MKLTDHAIDRRVSVYVLITLLTIAGLSSYISLPREASPEVEIPVILVSTPYIGVSPKDIESLVTQPLEQELKEVKDVDELRSTSAEGASLVVVEFRPGADLNEALQEVRERVDLARPELPEDAEEPIIQAISTADFPVMIVNVSGPFKTTELHTSAEALEDILKNIPGTLDVQLSGGLEREIQIDVDPYRLQHYGLSVQDIIDTVRNDNVNMPGGKIDVAEANFLVRVPAEVKDPSTIANFVVKTRDATPIFLGDVATVRDGHEEAASYARIDGRNSVSLTITKQPGAYRVDMSDEIHQKLKELEPTLPKGMTLTVLGDRSRSVRTMVHELENNMATGLLLVVIVMMIAMGLRNSLLVGVAIPLSMLLTFLALRFLGITLNMVGLISLILALGMLVDNAIVIVENIFRHASEGLSRFEAAKKATAEVAWPVTTSTLTTVAAFFPLLFWPGVQGDFMSYLPKTVIITLLASLFVALIATPVFCATFLRPAKEKPEEARQHESALLRFYQTGLNLALQHRWKTAAVATLVFFGTGFAFASAGLGVEFFPEVEPEKIFLSLDTGEGTALERTDHVMRRLETMVQAQDGIEHYVASSGVAGSSRSGSGGTVAHQGRLSIDFTPEVQGTGLAYAAIDTFREKTRLVPGAQIQVTKERMGPPRGKPIELEIYGDSLEVAARLVNAIKARIKTIPGLIELETDYKVGRPELRVDIDRERAGILQTPTPRIAHTVRTAIHGSRASVLREQDEEIDIMVRFAPEYRDSKTALEMLLVKSDASGSAAEKLVPLREIAAVTASAGTGSIRHKDQKRVITLSANVAEGFFTKAVIGQIKKAIAEVPFPPGYFVHYGGESADSAETSQFLSEAFVAAIFLIALILVTQFNSLFLPSIIMLSVVLSFIGVLWGQIITGRPFGIIMTGLGIISLAGIVVNNGIVLVDYIEKLRARGLSRRDALIQAGVVRLRPVILTAITTILGLLPMALGVGFDFSTFTLQAGGRSAAFWQPMAIAVISGLCIATLLTLVGVPTFYALFDDVSQKLRRLFQPKESPTAARPEQNSA